MIAKVRNIRSMFFLKMSWKYFLSTLCNAWFDFCGMVHTNNSSNNNNNPDSKVHGANMGPIGGRQDPGGLHVGPMNLAIWEEQQQ